MQIAGGGSSHNPTKLKRLNRPKLTTIEDLVKEKSESPNSPLLRK